MKRTKINSVEEFDLAVENNFEPLTDNRFDIQIDVRIQVQNEMFSNSSLSQRNVGKSNQKFYKYCWDRSSKFCEECGVEIPQYSASCVSHILPRSAYPEMRFDPRNVNILLPYFHQAWEDPIAKLRMRIYSKNQATIEQLKTEYNERK